MLIYTCSSSSYFFSYFYGYFHIFSANVHLQLTCWWWQTKHKNTNNLDYCSKPGEGGLSVCPCPTKWAERDVGIGLKSKETRSVACTLMTFVTGQVHWHSAPPLSFLHRVAADHIIVSCKSAGDTEPGNSFLGWRVPRLAQPAKSLGQSERQVWVTRTNGIHTRARAPVLTDFQQTGTFDSVEWQVKLPHGTFISVNELYIKLWSNAKLIFVILSDGETIVTPIVTTPGLDCSYTMKFLALASLCFVGLILADEKEKAEDYGTVIGIDLGTTYSW